MSEEPTCADCAYFLRDYAEFRVAERGLCRRYPPVFIDRVGAYSTEPYFRQVAVHQDDFCGEFKPKGNTAIGATA